MRVLILGAGFGGLELSTRLSNVLGDEIDVVLIDQNDDFVFGFSKLDVMFGYAPANAVRHPYASIEKPGVRFVRSTVRSIDPATKAVVTDDGTFEGDVLVVALGAEVHPEATPGLVDGGHEFYSVAGAFSSRGVLANFEGGRVVVGVTSTPFKCPPAPSETALLMHEYLTTRGLRGRSQIALVMPFGAPIPPSPPASEAVLAALAERDIEWHPQRLVSSLDPTRRVALFGDGSEMPFDLFLGVPVHRVPSVVEESGLAVEGWIPVDSLTLETDFPGVYAIGDVTSVGTPKAGVFAEGQAVVVASRIIDTFREQSSSSQYGGRGTCYLELGDGSVGRVDVTFLSGQKPTGEFDAPTRELNANKVEFGSLRAAQWFGSEWANLGREVEP